MEMKMRESWLDIELKDLFYAYRKAKADCFFERSICIARQFAEYEANLPENLSNLLDRLHAGKAKSILIENIGKSSVAAKKLGIKTKEDKKAELGGHCFFSDSTRAFEFLRNANEITPEFRLVGEFPVEMHVMSALWINLIGHKYDAALSKSTYGSRLRRYRPDPEEIETNVGRYHLETIGSFMPYFGLYRKWRERGMNAIREELEGDRSVVAISMDFTSYYHQIDPSFISKKRFLASAGIELDAWELDFTKAFVKALIGWSKLTAQKLIEMGCSSEDIKIGGLPIGLSISRIVSNALLISLDRDIEQGLAPIYYGRYVDDIFLVLRDPGHLRSTSALLDFISKRTECFPDDASNTEEIELKLPGGFQGATKLTLQKNKQKAFFLQGQAGLDLLDNIETQIRSVSSERRLMPSLKGLESMSSAKVLTAAAHPSEEADTLRRADGLSVRRLGLSIQLRAVEMFARDLRSDDWKDERIKFYEFAHSHILRPDKILDHIDYLPRLLSLAVALMDWVDALKLLDAVFTSLRTLRKHTQADSIKINGHKASGNIEPIWEGLNDAVRKLSADAITRSLRWSQRKGGIRPLSETALSVCEKVGLGTDTQEIERLSISLREADWAKTAYKDHLRRDATRQRPSVVNETQLHGLYDFEDDLRDCLDESSIPNSSGVNRVNGRCSGRGKPGKDVSLLPYLFPTRPYSTQEIPLFLPEQTIFGEGVQNPAKAWAKYTRAMRGIWVWGNLLGFDVHPPTVSEIGNTNQEKRFAKLGTKSKSQIKLGISSLLTNDDSYIAAAKGRSDISPQRYARIERIVNAAISAHPKPTHLLLPELSLPERWIDTVSGMLRDASISLIAGLDYQIGALDSIHSEAVLVLLDDRLGFPASVQIRQPKCLPAAGEEQMLLKLFGRKWTDGLINRQKPIYDHAGFHFGVLVCSELQNISYRKYFQGYVDCMMVLSWNQDLETFSALVESASLDVHAHIALVNNRKYGDSRVRVPAKAHHRRDLCRLRGGENEHVVVVELDIENLRAFQSRDKRWPCEDDPYKPVPEGFDLSGLRRTTPK
jgi:hypothetical protein